MRHVLSGIALFLFIFLLPVSVFAQEKKGPYFTSGSSVTISDTINGDVYAAGGTVIVDGTINGDLLVAGGTVDIKGQVTQDVRAAGGNVTISGRVGGNVTVGTGDFVLASTGSVGRSLVAGAGTMQLQGPINGNVYAGVGTLTLKPGSRINGNLFYSSGRKATIAPEAQINGQIKYTPTKMKQQLPEQRVQQFATGAAVIGKLINLIALFIIGLLIMYAFPTFTQRVVDTVGKSPGKSIGIGLLIFFFTPLLAFLIMIMFVGIPLALIMLFWYAAALYITKLFVIIFLGEWAMQYGTKQKSTILVLITGLIVYLLLTFIPVVGWFIGFVAMVWGLGASTLVKQQTYVSLRKKNLI